MRIDELIKELETRRNRHTLWLFIIMTCLFFFCITNFLISLILSGMVAASYWLVKTADIEEEEKCRTLHERKRTHKFNQ